MVKVKEDLTGRIFGSLTVIKQVEDYIDPKGNHKAQWLCECSCDKHTQKTIIGDNLKFNKTTRSCGCLKNKKKLAYDLRTQLNLKDQYGYYGIGYCSNTNKEFFFDMEDYEKIKNYCWHQAYSQKNNKIQRLRTHIIDKDGKTINISMHVLLGYKNYDHIDKNEFNNRKYNLRLCTHQQNCCNKSISQLNKSGFTGVYWNNKLKKWQVYITNNRKRKHLGYFTEKEDAIRARLQAEKEYFGEFAPQRHLFEEYGIEDDFSTNKKEE